MDLDPTISTFLKEKRRDLIQLYIGERKLEGEDGMLMITKVCNEMKVGYSPYSKLPKELQEEFNKMKEECNKPSIVYFYVCSQDNAFIMTIDIEDPSKIDL